MVVFAPGIALQNRRVFNFQHDVVQLLICPPLLASHGNKGWAILWHYTGVDYLAFIVEVIKSVRDHLENDLHDAQGYHITSEPPAIET